MGQIICIDSRFSPIKGDLFLKAVLSPYEQLLRSASHELVFGLP